MDLLDRLLRHDASTTRELLLVCRGLTDEQLDRPFDIGHRTVRATLVHILSNVEAWTDLMACRPASASHGKSIPELIARGDRAFLELETVARSVAERGAWDDHFLDTLDDPPVEKTLGGGIAHLITHSMHHRAQLLYMLRRLGVNRLPEGDVFSWEQQTQQVCLRKVAVADLDELFEHQCDPLACQMAAFPPRDREAFMTHWAKLLADAKVVARTIVAGNKVAGSVLCWEQSGEMLVGYWLGGNFWGRGVATRALADFVSLIPTRPLYARVAKHNLASIRVLEKCGFQVTGEGRAAALTGGEAVDELVYSMVE